jgi:hypothetical protein
MATQNANFTLFVLIPQSHKTKQNLNNFLSLAARAVFMPNSLLFAVKTKIHFKKVCIFGG